MGRIGPNAVTRLAEALDSGVGADRTSAVFLSAGHPELLRLPPTSMVDEQIVTRLHVALRRELGAAEATRVAAQAGHLTADYLLANRIPRPLQSLLRVLPAAFAAAILLAAIRRHAWTFAGSGTFGVEWRSSEHGSSSANQGAPVPRLGLSITGCPVCRGASASAAACDYYAATFERLFRALVQSRTTVVETACLATGADACRFLVSW